MNPEWWALEPPESYENRFEYEDELDEQDKRERDYYEQADVDFELEGDR